MLIDTRQVEQGVVIDAAVCIVGAGVAGITLARELGRSGITVCLIESGGLAPDDATRDLSRGDSIGLPYRFADGCRSRYFGGSSNCWGGWCRPLDASDFEERDWVPHSGWPFALHDLLPFYAHAHTLLQLGAHSFDPAFWETQIGRHDVRRIPLLTGRVRDTISQFSTPVRFGQLYRRELARTDNIRVLLHANVVDIDTDNPARTVSRVRVATLCGRTIFVTARQFILATGGIENARLLLASNKVQPSGLGNGNGLVGRYFMDHPRLITGQVRLQGAWARNRLYDIKYHERSRKVAAHGTRIAAQFALTPAVQQHEQLLNANVWLTSVFPGEGSEGAQALYQCKQILLKKAAPERKIGSNVASMMRHPVDTLGYALTRIYRPRALISATRFQAIVEPAPDPDSRVQLSPFRKDRLGLPRVQVDWRLGPQVKRTFIRTLEIMADELQRAGVADITLDGSLDNAAWTDHLAQEGTWHHMGTTRMHDAPGNGVVDRNCRVHGMSNLYVAGSSVFPTAGANFPTITIAALAFRLSEHILRELNAPQARVEHNVAELTVACAA